jgi:hypothetical protein
VAPVSIPPWKTSGVLPIVTVVVPSVKVPLVDSL